MIENWKKIPGYEDYQVSNLGRVKSFKYNEPRILKQREGGTSKYLRVVLCKNGKVKEMLVHQLVCMAFKGHNPDGFNGKIVDHINNDKLDNRLENLQVVPHRVNKSKDRKGTSKYTGVSKGYKNKWQSTIYINGKTKYLGCFDTEEEASEAYQNALLELNNTEHYLMN